MQFDGGVNKKSQLLADFALCPGLESLCPGEQLFIDNVCHKPVVIIKNLTCVSVFFSFPRFLSVETNIRSKETFLMTIK